MGETKRLVCLANSRKIGGRCIAGKELSGSMGYKWVRPVSARQNEEVSEWERQYEDGSDPVVADILDVPLIHHQPTGYQTENWLLDPKYYWVRKGSATWQDVHELVDQESPLWQNASSTYHGKFDRISTANSSGLTSSLRLIVTHSLSLKVFVPGQKFGEQKRRVQAQFNYLGVEYRLWVTDPKYEREYLAKPDGKYSLGNSLLTISLGEPQDGWIYKLLAAIIRPSEVRPS